jgi:hypothetical protein
MCRSTPANWWPEQLRSPAERSTSSSCKTSHRYADFVRVLLTDAQPVFLLFLMFRWQNDLTATYQTTPAINNSFGRNYFNVGGWYAPAGTTLPYKPMFSASSSLLSF